jgi:hypothetical protein
MLMLTGATMVGANIAWASIRNVNELIIPFSAEHKLEFHFGPCFYVNLVTGLVAFLILLINLKIANTLKRLYVTKRKILSKIHTHIIYIYSHPSTL